MAAAEDPSLIMVEGKGRGNPSIFLDSAETKDSVLKHPDYYQLKSMETKQLRTSSHDGQQSESSNVSIMQKDLNFVNRVKKLLGRRMLVGIKDGRFFLGSFYCIDKQGNIILQDAVEYRNTRRVSSSSPSPMERRGLGPILIPFSCRATCHVDCSIEEQFTLLSIT